MKAITQVHSLDTTTVRIQALLHMAKSINSIQGASLQGINYSEPTIDLTKIQYSLDQLESQFYFNNKYDFNNQGLVSREDHADTTKTITPQHNTHSVKPATNKLIWHYKQAIALPFIPSKLAIVGDGIHAIEIATIYQSLGSAVDIIIIGDEMFPELDKDINKTFQRYVKRLFKIKPQAEITAFNFVNNQVELSVVSKNKALPDTYYDAVFIVDDTEPQGDLLTQPIVITSVPTVTWVGWTEKQLITSTLNYKVINVPWRSLGRANTDVNTNGLTKLIFNSDDHKLIGGGMIGNNAEEIFGEICLAIHNKFTADNIAHTIHAHPTLHESILLAAEVYLGTATDVLNNNS